MTVLNKDGKPTQKTWDQMSSEEKMDALRQGLGYVIGLVVEANKKLDRIVAALDEFEKVDEVKFAEAEKPVVLDGK